MASRVVEDRGPWRRIDPEAAPECPGCGRALGHLERRGELLAGLCPNPGCGEAVTFARVEGRLVVRQRVHLCSTIPAPPGAAQVEAPQSPGASRRRNPRAPRSRICKPEASC